MKRAQLWRVSVKTSSEAEDAVAELLERVFGTAASSFDDLERGTVTVSAFATTKLARDQKRCRAAKDALLAIRSAGLDPGPARLSIKRVPPVDWAQAWKKHFKPIAIGSSLLIRPSWSKVQPRKGQALLELDPGLSFGTGQHPTTEHCLRELAHYRPLFANASLLDIGTGSGILALAGAKLGYHPVYAIDNDPEAIRIAQQNAHRNCVHACVTFAARDVLKLTALPKRQYTVICANLIADLLVEIRTTLACWIAPGGVIVVAGILDREFTSVQQAFTCIGLELVRDRRRGEWRSGTFQAP